MSTLCTLGLLCMKWYKFDRYVTPSNVDANLYVTKQSSTGHFDGEFDFFGENENQYFTELRTER